MNNSEPNINRVRRIFQIAAAVLVVATTIIANQAFVPLLALGPQPRIGRDPIYAQELARVVSVVNPIFLFHLLLGAVNASLLAAIFADRRFRPHFWIPGQALLVALNLHCFMTTFAYMRQLAYM